MNDTLISAETAKLAKEKGFNIPTWDFINTDGEKDNLIGWIGDTFEEKLERASHFIEYYLPTQSLLQKWFREVHNIHITIGSIGKTKYTLMIDEITLDGTLGKNILWTTYSRYEEALEVGLFEALKLI